MVVLSDAWVLAITVFRQPEKQLARSSVLGGKRLHQAGQGGVARIDSQDFRNMAVTSQQIVRHAEPLGLLAELGQVQLGGGNQQRHAALQQPCLGGAGGDAESDVGEPAGVGEVLGDVRRAGGMPAQDDALRVAAIFYGVALRPQQGGGDVLLRGGPGVLGARR